MTQTYEARGWIPASVGCHWTRGDYSISTYSQGAESGYSVYRNQREQGRYATFADAEKACDRRIIDRRASGR